MPHLKFQPAPKPPISKSSIFRLVCHAFCAFTINNAFLSWHFLSPHVMSPVQDSGKSARQRILLSSSRNASWLDKDGLCIRRTHHGQAYTVLHQPQRTHNLVDVWVAAAALLVSRQRRGRWGGFRRRAVRERGRAGGADDLGADALRRRDRPVAVDSLLVDVAAAAPIVGRWVDRRRSKGRSAQHQYRDGGGKRKCLHDAVFFFLCWFRLLQAAARRLLFSPSVTCKGGQMSQNQRQSGATNTRFCLRRKCGVLVCARGKTQTRADFCTRKFQEKSRK